MKLFLQNQILQKKLQSKYSKFFSFSNTFIIPASASNKIKVILLATIKLLPQYRLWTNPDT